MRLLIPAIFAITCGSVSIAQIVTDFDIPFDYNALKGTDYAITNDALSFSVYSGQSATVNVNFEETGCDGGRCKTGIYNKISFENRDHVKFYAVGKLVKTKKKPFDKFTFSGPIEIYYEENDQLLVKGNFGGTPSKLQPINDKIEVFWPNGKLKYEYL